ncbi:TlpA family protein disulfide reductase [Chloroflexota bacterium]
MNRKLVGVISMMAIVLLLASLALVAVNCSRSLKTSAETADGSVSGTNIGNLAPDFQMQSLSGEDVSLQSFRGRPVLLNFWASWCGPCRVEMPFLQGIFDDREWSSKGLVILTVNIGESSDTVKKFMEANQLSLPVVLDRDQKVAREYNIRAIPTTFFIDENGIIRDRVIGAFPNKSEIEKRLSNSIIEE